MFFKIKFSIVSVIILTVLIATIACSAEESSALPFYNILPNDHSLEMKAILESKTDSSNFVSGFRQCYTSKHKIVDKQTAFKITYDADNIYFQVLCEEPEINNLKTTVFQRDGKVWNDDCVEIFISAKAEGQPYYQFIVNSSGTLFDLSSKLREKKAWNSNATVKVAKGNNRWIILLTVSRFDLNIKNTDVVLLRGNVCRTRRAGGKEQPSAWSPTPKGYHSPKHFGYIILGSLKDNLLKSLSLQAPLIKEKIFQINRKLQDNPAIKAKFSEKTDRISSKWRELNRNSKAALEHMSVLNWKQYNQKLNNIITVCKQINNEIDFEIVLQ